MMGSKRKIEPLKVCGVPMPGQTAVFCDVAAYIGGVNHNSILKLLAVMDAISRQLGIPLEELAKYENLPESSVYMGGPQFQERADATAEFSRKLVESGALDAYPHVHKLQKRVHSLRNAGGRTPYAGGVK